MKVFCDTSVLVASLVPSHAHHGRATNIIEGILAGRDTGAIAAHALLETYAVLTSLPLTPRIGPVAAEKLVTSNLVAHFDVVALTSREYAGLIRSLPDNGTMGGAGYDALHLACAEKASADRIYTFNVSDFRRINPVLADKIVAP